MKLKEKICRLFLPKDSKIVKKDVVTIDDLIKTQSVNVPSLNLIPSIPITQEMIEGILKQFPKSEQPTIVESDGKLAIIGTEEERKKFGIALLSIVPIPYIPIGSEDIDQYYDKNFGEGSKPQVIDVGKLEELAKKQVKIPGFSVITTPIPIKKEEKSEK